jgi:NitT/TauT family transport system ATP-binding protein
VFVTHSVYESVYLSSRIVVMAARPGRVVADLPVDAPRDRTEEFRTTALYGELCRQASRALHGAMAPDEHL